MMKPTACLDKYFDDPVQGRIATQKLAVPQLAAYLGMWLYLIDLAQTADAGTLSVNTGRLMALS